MAYFRTIAFHIIAGLAICVGFDLLSFNIACIQTQTGVEDFPMRIEGDVGVGGYCRSNATQVAIRILFVFALWPLAAITGDSTGPSPVGLWRTISDVDGKPRGVVRITEKDGVYSAAIVRSLVPGEEDMGVCDVCPDARKGQPYSGLVFLTGLRKESSTEYVGGEILDPDTGSIYRCQARLENNGQSIVVRSYIGISLFGRSQVWQRAE